MKSYTGGLNYSFKVHKYMNKTFNLAAVIMRKKPEYISGKRHKTFHNLLNQNFTVDEKKQMIQSDTLII